MNWRLIFLLSTFGVLMAIASVFGMTRGIEPLLWLLIFVLYAWWIVKNCRRLYFLHAFMASVINGIWISIIHAAFFSTYTRHNPEVVEKFKTLPPGVNLRVLMLAIGPLLGAIFGVIAGLFAIVAARVAKKKEDAEE
ncbi:MAG: hypothetical protein C5B55_00195 [Blastocatellia bacterium]|nr:MAG: hypothetical protein C5B55_00195 [Blastocatellia bacterium]